MQASSDPPNHDAQAEIVRLRLALEARDRELAGLREGMAQASRAETATAGRHDAELIAERAHAADLRSDIVDLETLRDLLRTSEGKFHAIADSVDQMIWSTLPDGYHDYYNQRWYDYTGVPSGSTDGEGWNGMFHPDDQERAWSTWRRSLETGEPYRIEYRLRHRSGDYRWVLGRAQAVRDADGAIIRWYGTCTDIDDLKRAEEALRESEEFNRRILASSNDCIKVLSLDGKLETMSPGGRVVMEVEDFAAIKGADWEKMWPAAEQAKVAAAMQEARAGEIGRFQGYSPTARGTMKYWDVMVSPIEGADGRPEKLLAISRDISALRDAQDSLLESEQRYRALFETIDEGFCIIQFLDGPHGPLSDYEHIEANPAYLANAGIENIVGKRLREIVSESEADAWSAVYRDVLVTGTPVRFERELVETGRYLELAAFRVEPVERRQVAVLFQDITTRRRIEEQMRASEDRLRLATEAADVGTWDFNPDTGALRWDDRCKALFGMSPDAHIDYDIFLAGLHPDDRAATDAAVAAALEPTGPGFYRVQYRTVGIEDGVERWIAAMGRSVFAGQGPERRATRFIGTVIDISEPKRAEEELRHLNETLEERVTEEVARRAEAEEALRQAQKMETLGQLTGGVAHDFNNLLQIVSGNIDLIQRGLPEDAGKLRRAAENAARGAERAAVLTQRLLAFSRRQPLAPKPIDPNRMVSGMSDLLHRTLGETVEVETVLAPRVWPIEADPNQLENAILNLAINARDAMAGGGKLTIETCNTHLDRAYVAQNAEVMAGQYVCIAVSDTGAGMDADTVTRAFEPFFTTKDVGKGTGLGLSMVYGFVKQSGGHLKIYSERGEGTTVKIYLPRLLGGQPVEDIVEETIVPEGAQSETVLVCEDDDDVRAYTVEVLRELGYRVLEAHDAAAALSLIERPGEIDLLFTDVVLPGGMTGAVLAREARQLRPELKVLFTTGYARNAIVHHGRLDPGVELITKPFSYADLAARVRDMLDGQP